jgi:dTDP-4-dehydrorhamnose 3,5-epimerase
MNISFTSDAFTLRGMHYQLPPDAETKLVRCVRGRILDVALDLRASSSTFGRHVAIELRGDGDQMLFVPRGFAHGFMTLEPNVEVQYAVSARHATASERGIRYDDPRFAIAWPTTPRKISDKDRSWPLFEDAFHGSRLLDAFL